MMTKRQKAEADAKSLAEALAGAANKCSSNTEKRCQGMTYALHYQAERGGGLEVGMTLNLKTGNDIGLAFVYRTTKGGKLMYLNHCPFCGANVKGAKS